MTLRDHRAAWTAEAPVARGTSGNRGCRVTLPTMETPPHPCTAASAANGGGANGTGLAGDRAGQDSR